MFNLFIPQGKVSNFIAYNVFSCQTLSKKDGKDQETIQSRTTPDPGYNMGK